MTQHIDEESMHSNEIDSAIDSEIDTAKADATRIALGEPARSGSLRLRGRVAALAGIALAVAVPLSLVLSDGSPTTVTYVI